VRLTSLVKSSAKILHDDAAVTREEKKAATVSPKSQSVFLHSEALSLLQETIRSKGTSHSSETPAAGLPEEAAPFDERPGKSVPAALPPRQTVPGEPAPAVTARTSADSRVNIPYPDDQDDYFSFYRGESMIADAIYIEMIDLLETLYAGDFKNREQKIERLISLTEQLIDVCERSNVILRKAVQPKVEEDTLVAHSLNAAILAIKIGIKRKFPRERLFSLATCALLSDVGMTKVPRDIIEKKSALTTGEFEQIAAHVRYSQEILARDFKEFPFLVPIAAQIHERENGSGYPNGLRGEGIHEFAKILGLCDVYIAMVSRKAHRIDFSGYATLQQIISRRGIDFSPSIIKSLIDVISVFPLESLVRLNNGEIGRVIEVSADHPTRPNLLILLTSDGEHPKTAKIVDLEKEPLLYVEYPDVEEGVVLSGGAAS
jgi:HD-GYP domain-containing protein (c-di-GMP phosphodiesterase class II)